MARLTHVFLSGALIAAFAIVGVGCDDDDNGSVESNSNASQQSVEELDQRVQRNEMLNGVLHISGLGLHDIDENLNNGGEIEPSYAPSARTAARVLGLTDWGEHQADADAAVEAAADLLAALQDEDTEAAASAATDLHDTWHDLESAVWEDIAADLPPDAGGPEDHGDSGDGTAETDPTAVTDDTAEPDSTGEAQ